MAFLPENSVLLSFDEKGKTAIKKYGGQKYTFKGYYHIPYGQKVRGICDLFMTKNVHTGQRHHTFFDWKNSWIVTEYLEKLLIEYPDVDIYIIWDGWSAHRSEHTQIWLDLHPRIKILPLPTRASWLNPVERDFGQIQRFCLNNSNFETVKEAMHEIGRFIKKELSPT
ncbi:MAG: IS630 family transposase [Nanoarchaeota archaeon]